MQIPSGTVESDETPQNAALRELHEETGIAYGGTPMLLKVLDANLPPDRSFMITSSVIEAQTPNGKYVEFNFRRGLPVRILTRRASSVRVAYEEFDYNQIPPKLTCSYSGIVPTTSCATLLRRHFFHMGFGDYHSRLDSWEHGADGQHWRMEWLDLSEVVLFGEQDSWFQLTKDTLEL